jgi:archaellum biogenesis protein FlaJ (TadC family)
MIEELKRNIEHEKKIILDISSILANIQNPEDQSFYEAPLNALTSQLKIINQSIPLILNETSPVKSLNSEAKKPPQDIIKLSYVSPMTKERQLITINKKDKDTFVKELQISESGLSNLKKIKNPDKINISKPSKIAGISSKFFSGFSESLAPKFSGLSEDLKKANIRFLTSTYISLSLFISFLIFFSTLLLFILFIILGISTIMWIWVPFAILGLSLAGFYFYPSIERGGLQKRINQELPFATIHMAAIAGSNVEPTKILKIIADSPEYPNISMEIRKVINQTDLYGYDLVTALRTSSKQTSNKKLAELFNGMAINITSGGDLKNYLEKKAENFMTDFKLERQRYNDLAGTFMDVYISILITAPLILMMMFIVMNISGLKLGNLSLDVILILSVAAIVLINLIFIFVLEVKQPKG